MLKGDDLKMAERLREHPILVYLTFVMPMLLLALGIILKANVFLLILVSVWLGVAFVVLFLPVAPDEGGSPG